MQQYLYVCDNTFTNKTGKPKTEQSRQFKKTYIMKKILKFTSCFLLGSIILSSCNNGDSSKAMTAEATKLKFDLTVAKKEIEAANQNTIDLFAKHDSVGMANLYTKDAKLLFANAPAVVGRAAIQSVFSGIVNSPVTSVNFETIEVFGSEDLLAEEGKIRIYIKDKVVSEEKSIVLWKKEDGKWKMFRDISNTNTK